MAQRSKDLRIVECCAMCKYQYAGDNGCKFYTKVADWFKCNKFFSATGKFCDNPIPDYEKKHLRDKPTTDF